MYWIHCHLILSVVPKIFSCINILGFFPSQDGSIVKSEKIEHGSGNISPYLDPDPDPDLHLNLVPDYLCIQLSVTIIETLNFFVLFQSGLTFQIPPDFQVL